jgi:hypothetical protein
MRVSRRRQLGLRSARMLTLLYLQVPGSYVLGSSRECLPSLCRRKLVLQMLHLVFDRSKPWKSCTLQRRSWSRIVYLMYAVVAYKYVE